MSGGPPAGATLPPRISAFAFASLDDPYPAYRQLRDAGPLLRGGPGQWIATRYQDVAPLLRDPRLGQFTFSAAFERLPPEARAQGIGESAAEFVRHAVASIDGPEHLRLRQLLARSMTPFVKGVDPLIAAAVEDLVGRALAQGVVDFVADLATPLPLQVLGALLSLEPGELPAAVDHVTALARVFGPTLSDDQRRQANEAVGWLRASLRASAARRGGEDDFGGRLFGSADASGGGMEPALVDNSGFLLFAGLDTTIDFLANAAAALAEHPAEFRRLGQEPGLVPSAVEELLRYDSPLQVTGRRTLERLDVGGRSLSEGRLVLLLLGSANRDERHFRHPDTLDLARQPNPQLAFGAGTHFCLGAQLARKEAAALFGALAARCSALEPAGAARRGDSGTLRGFRSLPLRLVPR